MQTLAEADLVFPPLLERRWKYLKTEMHRICINHAKKDLIRALISEREHHTSAPTLSEITKLTGFDVAIHTIQNWEWNPKNQGNLEIDAKYIGEVGAELMVLHAIRESIKNDLVDVIDGELVLTEMGKRHFDTVNSFNVDITGNRIDIAKKRFSTSRMNKTQREMDPINKLRSVRRLYWENSIIMLLRAPLPFYRAMKLLTKKEIEVVIEMLNKLTEKKNQHTSELKKVRVPVNSKVFKVLKKLTPEKGEDRRPKFVTGILEEVQNDKAEFSIGVGALTMFVMFLQGFKREQLDEKARRAEQAVKDVIEYADFWEVVDTNTEIIDEGGETVTEIDIIARSKKDPDQWVHCEVKDFSYWRGWIFGQNIGIRKQYYEKAVEKLPVKEEYIKNKYQCNKINSFIVTSIPEAFESINGVSLVYLSDLNEVLASLNKRNFTPRRKYSSQNFLIRYYRRLKNDYETANEVNKKIINLKEKYRELKTEYNKIKKKFDEKKAIFDKLLSSRNTLQVSKKFTTKRLVKDDGTKHYQIEEELKKIKHDLQKVNREIVVCQENLKGIKLELKDKKNKLEKINTELGKLQQKQERLLAPRGI